MLSANQLPGVLAGLALAMAACGCGRSSSPALASFDLASDPASNGGATPQAPAVSEPGDPAPRASMITPEGVQLLYPVWLDHHPERKAELLVELRDVVPEADPRISTDHRGVPAGVTLIVLDPGAYYAPYSPTLLASGEWRAPATIYVCWRATSSGPLVPALPHELRHLLTADPLAGH